MNPISKSLKDGSVIGGTLLLLIMTLPLVVLLFFTLRFVLVVAGAIAVLGCLAAYTCSPAARAWIEARLEAPCSRNGLHERHVAT